MQFHLHVPHALQRHGATATPRPLTDEERHLRTTRDLTVLVAVASGAAVVLWTVAAAGAAGTLWWALVVVAAIALVVALGAWVLVRDR